MFMTQQEHGDEYDKPYTKQFQAMNLIRTAAYGTATVLALQDLDEFMVLPSGKPIQQLLAPGGCLDGIWRHSQATVRSKVTVATDWINPDPNSKGELPAWLEHGLWVDALEALNYSMAPQGFYGWKSMIDPNSDYNLICECK
jgi:hypothetical protein